MTFFFLQSSVHMNSTSAVKWRRTLLPDSLIISLHREKKTFFPPFWRSFGKVDETSRPPIQRKPTPNSSAHFALWQLAFLPLWLSNIYGCSHVWFGLMPGVNGASSTLDEFLCSSVLQHIEQCWSLLAAVVWKQSEQPKWDGGIWEGRGKKDS